MSQQTMRVPNAVSVVYTEEIASPGLSSANCAISRSLSLIIIISYHNTKNFHAKQKQLRPNWIALTISSVNRKPGRSMPINIDS